MTQRKFDKTKGFGTVRMWGVWKEGDNDIGPVIAQICIENPGGAEEFLKYRESTAKLD